eukprot:4268999-Prymnesium_polylepis.1
MGYGKSTGFASNKKKKARQQQAEAEPPQNSPDTVFDDPDVEEPPLAQPARKKGVFVEPTRQSRRGKPDPFKPTP